MPPIVKVPLKYGVISGILTGILIVVLYYFVVHPFEVPVFFDFRIFIFGVFIFFTLRELRDYHLGGVLFFWQGLIASLLLTVVFAVLSSALLALLGAMDPHFLESYISFRMEFLKSLPAETVDQIGKDVYERNLNDLPSTNMTDLVLLYFAQSFMISFFISIILSVILRTQPKT